MLDYSENKYTTVLSNYMNEFKKLAEWYIIIKVCFLKQRNGKYKFQAGVTYVGKVEQWDGGETYLLRQHYWWCFIF